MKLRRALTIFICLLSTGQALAEPLPFNFANNGVKLNVTRSKSDSRSVISVEVKATGQMSYHLTEARNPARLVIDFQGARVTRSRSFELTDSKAIKSVRCGVHPDHLRVVVEMRTPSVPQYSLQQTGDWFTILVDERGDAADLTPAASNVPESWNFDEIGFQTEVWDKTSHDLHKNSANEQTFTNLLEVKPKLSVSPTQNLKAVASAKLRLFSEFEQDSDSEFEARPHEIYASYSDADYGLRAGNQIITWGKADEISPLDNINPEDYRDDIVRRRSERKIPVPIIQAEALGNEERLQAVYIPFFQRSRIDIQGSDWSVLGNSVNEVPIVEDQPDNDLSSGGYGLRYAGNFESFDAAISFLSTPSHFPVFSAAALPPNFQGVPQDTDRGDIAALAQSSGAPLLIEYPRQETYGVEFETTYGQFGIRGDLAITHGSRFLNTQLQNEERTVITPVIGFDYTSSSEFYINFQYSPSYVNNYDDSLLMSERFQHSFYSEFSKELFNNKLKPGFRWLVAAPLNGYFLNPYVLISEWDDVTFELGGNFLGGNSASPIGYYSDNDEAYILTKIFF